MSALKKWVYWHRVTESFDEKYPPGSLLGLSAKETQVAGFIEVGEGKNFHINFKILANLKFLDRMPRIATAEEIVAAFPKEE